MLSPEGALHPDRHQSRPPQTSWKQATVPSPPSATGMHTSWHAGNNILKALPGNLTDISPLERDPLNESEITMHFFMRTYAIDNVLRLSC